MSPVYQKFIPNRLAKTRESQTPHGRLRNARECRFTNRAAALADRALTTTSAGSGLSTTQKPTPHLWSLNRPLRLLSLSPPLPHPNESSRPRNAKRFSGTMHLWRLRSLTTSAVVDISGWSATYDEGTDLHRDARLARSLRSARRASRSSNRIQPPCRRKSRTAVSWVKIL